MVGRSEVQGSGPVSQAETRSDGFGRLHLEPLFEHVVVELFEVQDGTPLPWSRLWGDKEMIVITWTVNVFDYFYDSLLKQFFDYV